MKIGIITASQEDYTLRLLYFLKYKSHKPDYVILVKQGIVPKILNRFSLRTVISFMQEKFNNRRPADTNHTRDHLAYFLESQMINIPDVSLAQACKREGVALINISDLQSEKTLSLLRHSGVDILINAGGGIFKRGIIDAVNIGILNAHMGLLPDFRGMNVLEWSLFYDRPIGVTLHIIDKGIDTGDILSFREIPIENGDTIADLRNKSAIANFILFAEVIAGFTSHTIYRKKQLPHEGRQYFVMHSRLRSCVERSLSRYHIRQV